MPAMNNSPLKTALPGVPYKGIAACLLLVSLLVAVYWQVHEFSFVNFDDPSYVYENDKVRAGLSPATIKWAFLSLENSNWHPLTWISHMIDVELFGLDAGRHHLMNVFFHALNSILLYMVLQFMTKACWRSFFVAALFALHPMHVESVAWISERKDVLSAFFWMLTMICYYWYTRRPSLPKYMTVFCCLGLGLMAKPMLVTLPFVLILLDYWPLKRIQPLNSRPDGGEDPSIAWTRSCAEKIPLLVLVICSSIITYLAQNNGAAITSYIEYPFVFRIANSLLVYIQYACKMIFPVKLAVYYPHPVTFAAWQISGACLLLTGVTIISVRFLRSSPFIGVGWLWYLGTLIPVIGVVQVGGQAMADRYTYLPFIGLFVMIAWGFEKVVRHNRFKEIISGTAATLILLVCLGLTRGQTGHWRNSISLFGHAVNVTENNTLAMYNLGVALIEQDEYEEAIKHFSRVLELNPDYPGIYNGLGIAYSYTGNLDKAELFFQRELRKKPDNQDARKNLEILKSLD